MKIATPRAISRLISATGRAAGAGQARLTVALGGSTRTRVVVTLACVLSLSSADVATVGASATELRQALHIGNTELGLLVTITSLVAAFANLPFGVLADRFRRTWTLAAAITCWGAAMVWSATAGSFEQLLLARLLLGVVTAAAGPVIASLTGDYFLESERGRIYGYILAGELVGAGLGFGVTGDIAALSWRAAFLILAIPAFVLAWMVARLPEPARGGAGALAPETPADGRLRVVPDESAPTSPDTASHAGQPAPTPPRPDTRCRARASASRRAPARRGAPPRRNWPPSAAWSATRTWC